MIAAQPTIDHVSSRRGAPMGRTEWPAEPTGPVRVFRVPLVDGYDHGGAYWGCGDPLYCATDGDAYRRFWRAPSRVVVVAHVRDEWPDVVFAGADADTLAEVLAGYLEAAAWADAPEGSRARWCAESRAKAERDCEAWIVAAGSLGADAMARPGYSAARFGHDFWMTRSGHGCGYWDRSELENGDALTERVRTSFRSIDLYTARGWMYFEGA